MIRPVAIVSKRVSTSQNLATTNTVPASVLSSSSQAKAQRPILIQSTSGMKGDLILFGVLLLALILVHES